MPEHAMAAKALFPIVALVATALAAAEPPVVRVTWLNPVGFTDFGDRRHPEERTVESYADELGDHLSRRAMRALSPGDRLEITVRDVDMAGAFEPALRASLTDVRILKEIYPPRIDLDYVLARADGSRHSGRCELVDTNYLTHAKPAGSDPLRYEKAMVDGWVDTEIRAAPARPPRSARTQCRSSRD
jgi:hypothetical protein